MDIDRHVLMAEPNIDSVSSLACSFDPGISGVFPALLAWCCFQLDTETAELQYFGTHVDPVCVSVQRIVQACPTTRPITMNSCVRSPQHQGLLELALTFDYALSVTPLHIWIWNISEIWSTSEVSL